MIKFKILAEKKEVESFQNKIVCHVVDSHMENKLLGKISIWKGSTENEYFSIMFANGILNVALSEREIYLGDDAIDYAITENADKEGEYHSLAEQDAITFDDILVALNWTPVKGMKFENDKFST